MSDFVFFLTASTDIERYLSGIEQVDNNVTWPTYRAWFPCSNQLQLVSLNPRELTFHYFLHRV